MTWTVTIPMQIPSANTLKRALYGGNKRLYKQLRTDFGWLLKANARDVPRATGRRRVTVIRLIGKGGKTYDTDNLCAGAKPLIDELVELGLLIDDSPTHVSIAYRQERAEKGAPPATKIEICDDVDTRFDFSDEGGA